ncbi:MAG: hypothetical protein ACTSWE_09765 [Promethearchaeota archaeon]
MEFENRTSPSVIDETSWKENEEQVSVKPELEVATVLSHFEEQREPIGKIKKKSKEQYQNLLKLYWPYYLIPLTEENSAIGIDGMALSSLELFKGLAINEEQIRNELKNLEDDALLEGLATLQEAYSVLGEKKEVNGLLNPEFTKALIDLSSYSLKEGYLGISITPVIDENDATEIFKKVDNYTRTIAELKNDIDKKNQIIEEALIQKKNKIAEEIKAFEEEYNQKVNEMTPIVEENKKNINTNRQTEIEHLKEERNKEIIQTMNLIKESFKPIEAKVAFLNDLWEKDKNTVLNMNESEELMSEIEGSINRFKDRLKEFDTELTNIRQEIHKIAERFIQINQKYENEENIVNSKYDKQIQEEDAKISALENEKSEKIKGRREMENKIDQQVARLQELTNSFKEQLDQSTSDLNEYIARNTELGKAIKLEVPIWVVKFLHVKEGSRQIVMPPVFLPRIAPKKIKDDGLGQREIPVIVYNKLFITHLKEAFQKFLQEDSDVKRQVEEDIGEQDYFKIKEIRNRFIDGIEMLLGRQLISSKSKEVIQAHVLAAFKSLE